MTLSFPNENCNSSALHLPARVPRTGSLWHLPYEDPVCQGKGYPKLQEFIHSSKREHHVPECVYCRLKKHRKGIGLLLLQ